MLMPAVVVRLEQIHVTVLGKVIASTSYESSIFALIHLDKKLVECCMHGFVDMAGPTCSRHVMPAHANCRSFYPFLP